MKILNKSSHLNLVFRPNCISFTLCTCGGICVSTQASSSNSVFREIFNRQTLKTRIETAVVSQDCWINYDGYTTETVKLFGPNVRKFRDIKQINV